jgi:hypothetical protein
MIVNEIMPKLCSPFYCEKCDYRTSKKSSYTNHTLSAKHQKSMISNEIMPKLCSRIFQCEKCDKEYKDYSGLWRHNKKCKDSNIQPKSKDSDSSNFVFDKDFVMMILKQNQEIVKQNSELQNQIMEVVKNGTNNTTNTLNSHNKSFNLQFFLNETCKDAMNIMDFVESIQLQLSDLEKVGEIGFVEGISNIIVKNLKALDVTQRPVHCTDKKREVLYVKDEDKWEKQDEDNVKLRKVIKKVTDKNMRLIPKYREKYPDCNKSISRHSDQYNKIIVESMGGSGDNDHEKASKIIKNISKQVLVEKEPEVATL